METILIQPTPSTPAIIISDNNKLVIRGHSIPANETKFYQPVLEWAGKVAAPRLVAEINLEYLSSGSIKMLLYLLKTLDFNAGVKKLFVKWYYEEGDENAHESGRVFKEILHKAQFRFCKYRNAC
jgi:hypothetical protein